MKITELVANVSYIKKADKTYKVSKDDDDVKEMPVNPHLIEVTLGPKKGAK